jgi:hypothetical protein
MLTPESQETLPGKKLRGKTPSRLMPELDRRLSLYALVAGATGAGLAMAPPADAEIVYTPAHVVIGYGGVRSYALDLNQDGTIDFTLKTLTRASIDDSGGTQVMFALPAQGNGVAGYGGAASPLKAGVSIDSKLKFAGRGMASDVTFIGTTSHARGPWVNVANRYLGLKFEIDGQTHYGWARITVQVNTVHRSLVAALTGYAYETTVDTPIVAGQTSGNDVGSAVPGGLGTKPGTLGALALGAPAVAIWRKDDRAE